MPDSTPVKNGLVPAGATFKHIPKAYYSNLSKSPAQLIGITGNTMSVYGTVTISLSIGNENIKFPFKIVRGFRKPMILGIDFLQETNSCMDFEKRTLRVGTNVVMLENTDRNTPNCCALVRVRNRTYIPAETVMMIAGTVSNSGLQGDFVVIPLDNAPMVSDQPGLLVPNVITSINGGGKVPLSLINMTKRGFLLKRNQVLAAIEPLDPSEISQAEYDEGLTDAVVADKASLGHLPFTERKQLQALLRQCDHLFARTDGDLGCTDLTQVNLDTGDHPPVRQRPYRTPFTYRPLVNEHVDSMLENGIVRPSTGWLS